MLQIELKKKFFDYYLEVIWKLERSWAKIKDFFRPRKSLMNPLRTQRLKFVTMIVLTAKSTVRPVFDLVLFYSLNQEI